MQYADDEQAQQSIRRMIALKMFAKTPRFHTGRLEAGDTIVDDWKALVRTCDSLAARTDSFHEIRVYPKTLAARQVIQSQVP